MTSGWGLGRARRNTAVKRSVSTSAPNRNSWKPAWRSASGAVNRPGAVAVSVAATAPSS
ncbi:MAG: hypothetical protein R2882_08785 [Gemmatimonadales bacterium]